jgi:hypothetical protein
LEAVHEVAGLEPPNANTLKTVVRNWGMALEG